MDDLATAPASTSDGDEVFLDCVTDRALAETFRVHPTTLRRWRKNGTGPAWIMVAQRVFYRRAAVSAWLLQKEQQAQILAKRKNSLAPIVRTRQRILSRTSAESKP